MHIKIDLISDTDIILPVHYNHILQGFIYNNIDKRLSGFLHNNGYIYYNRTFKLFTFSRISEKGIKIDDMLYFGKHISFVVSSPLKEFCNSFTDTLLQKDRLLLGQNIVRVHQIRPKDNVVDKESIVIRTLSPIVAYSTLFRHDGSKYTCFFMPGESDFKRIISENLIKKYKALFNYNNDNFYDYNASIKPIGSFKQNFVIYKGFIIKGVTGTFELKGDKRLLQMGLDAGIGSKNSQGFGCIDYL
ncbi:MAG TPA: CRISPR-associated endoribonuclease Cas6 [Mobilitalea sp.]|nr:CRISPR-associated endoribonuclease Cas6 [Mobilitalea sp.]